MYVVDLFTMDTFDPAGLFVESNTPCFVVVVVEDAAVDGDVRTDNDDVATDAGDGSVLVLNVNAEDFAEASDPLPVSVVESLTGDVGRSDVHEDVAEPVLLLDVIVLDFTEDISDTVECFVEKDKPCLAWSLIVSG